MKHGLSILGLFLLACASTGVHASERPLMAAGIDPPMPSNAMPALGTLVSSPSLSPGFIVVVPPGRRAAASPDAAPSLAAPLASPLAGPAEAAADVAHRPPLLQAELAVLSTDGGRGRAPGLALPAIRPAATPASADDSMVSPISGLAAVILMICILIGRRNKI